MRVVPQCFHCSCSISWLRLCFFYRKLAWLPQRGWRQVPEAPVVGGHGCTGETKSPLSLCFTRAEFVSVNHILKFYFKHLIFKKRTAASDISLSQIWHTFVLSLLASSLCPTEGLMFWVRGAKNDLSKQPSWDAVKRVCFFCVDRWRHGFHREDELHPQGPTGC